MYLKLDDIKKQCVVEHDEDDQWLLGLGEAAEEGMRDFLGRELDEIANEEGNLPRCIYQALLMLVEELYKERGVTTGFQQYENAAFRFLTQSYVKYVARR